MTHHENGCTAPAIKNLHEHEGGSNAPIAAKRSSGETGPKNRINPELTAENKTAVLVISGKNSENTDDEKKNILTIALRRAMEEVLDRSALERLGSTGDKRDMERLQFLVEWTLQEIIERFRIHFFRLINEDTGIHLGNSQYDAPQAVNHEETRKEPGIESTHIISDHKNVEKIIEDIFQTIKNNANFCPGKVKIADNQNIEGMFTAYNGKLFFYYLTEVDERQQDNIVRRIRFLKDIDPKDVVSFQAPDEEELKAMEKGNSHALWAHLIS